MSNINPSKIGNSQNTFAVVDSRQPNRWLDAWGDINKAIVSDIWKADEFVVTATGTSPITASVVSDAVALITTGANDFDGDNIQVVGTRFEFEANKPMYFGAKLTVSDATHSDLVVGLFGLDTTLTAASTAHALNIGAGGAGFTKLDEVTACFFKTFTTETEKNSAAAFTLDNEAHIYELYWDGAALHGYIDGSLVGKFTADITTEVLTPSIAFRSGSAGAKTCTIHWMRCIQVRG